MEASTTTLTIREGETRRYSVRLTKQPHAEADGDWWVMIVVDGDRRGDGYYPAESPIVSWMPSLGRRFDRNDWNQWKNISIKALQDDDSEDHTIIFSSELWDHDTYCPPDLHGAGTPLAKVTVHIIDDDALPGLTIEDAAVQEGGAASFDVTLSRMWDQAVTVNYRTAGGTATENTDYDGESGTLTFEPGDTRKTIEVQTTEDDTDEPDETFTVTLSSPSGATLDDGTATGTINDDDGPPVLSIGDEMVEEGGTAQFTVTLTPVSGKTVTVAYATADGSAEAGSDYTAASGTLTFEAGDTQMTIEVATREDAIDEHDEMSTVTLSSPREATLGDHTAAGTITDDDEPPMLSIEGDTVVEGGTAEFRVTLTPAASGQAVTVNYATSDGTAEEGQDYDKAFGLLTFNDGDSEKTISVTTRQDELEEGEETFLVTLSGPVGATLAVGSATGRITDDDTGDGGNGGGNGNDGNGNNGDGNNGNNGGGNNGNGGDGNGGSNNGDGNSGGGNTGGGNGDGSGGGGLSLSIAHATVVEGGTAEFGVTLSGASNQAVTVHYRTAAGTAASGDDFVAAQGTLTFAPGSTAETIDVQTLDDDIYEGEETFSVRLSAPSGATLAEAAATGTIVDNDGEPVLRIGDAAAVEGGTVTFAVSLSRASDQAVTVLFRTVDGTAAAGDDYTARSGTLTFAPGSREETIEVQTLADDLDEPDETFTVRLSNANGATLRDRTAMGTITDDDVRAIAPVNRQLVPELGRALAFTAVRCRIEQVFSDSARGWARPAVSPSLSVAPISAAPAPLDWIEQEDDRSLTLEQVLGNSSFFLPLLDGSGGRTRFATWGCGDFRSLAGDGGGTAGAWDGEAFSLQVGADAIVGPDLLAGASLSQSQGSLEFDGVGIGNDPSDGHHDLRLTGVHPYLGWWVSPDIEVWGTLGVARGELQIADTAAGSSESSGATLASGTVGLNGRLLELGSTTLKLKGELAFAMLDVSSATALFRGASVDLQRFRLAAEIDHEEIVPYVGVLAPWGELGLRNDGGDGGTGSSLELGGGLLYRNIERGWNAEVYGRWVMAQDDALPDERGIGLRFRYDPEPPGFGPWARLAQTWGGAASGLHRLWDDEASGLAAYDPAERRLDLDAGYGFEASGGRGALTPFGAVSLGNVDGQRYRLGTRLSLAPGALLSLEGERRERPGEPADHAIVLRGIARF